MKGLVLFEDGKNYLVDHLHLGRDALHIYVALAVFFGVCLLFRWKASQWRPLLAVVIVACAGELWDICDQIGLGQAADFHESIKDIANTVFVPMIIMLLARYSRVFR